MRRPGPRQARQLLFNISLIALAICTVLLTVVTVLS